MSYPLRPDDGESPALRAIDAVPRSKAHSRWKGRLMQSRYNSTGQRVCFSCCRWLDPSMFNKNPKTRDKLNGICCECQKTYRTKWRLWRRYKLTPEDVDRRLEDQEWRCAICRVSITRETLHIDHDSECCPGLTSAPGCGKCVRGLTCSGCNTGMGCFSHDPEILQAAIAYLIHHQRGGAMDWQLERGQR